MACRQPGDKPLPEPMMAWIGDAYMPYSASASKYYSDATLSDGSKSAQSKWTGFNRPLAQLPGQQEITWGQQDFHRLPEL